MVTGAAGKGGKRAHSKKADLSEQFIHYWEAEKEVAHMYPALDVNLPLAGSIWNMRADDMTRVQLMELVEALAKGDAVCH